MFIIKILIILKIKKIKKKNKLFIYKNNYINN